MNTATWHPLNGEAYKVDLVVARDSAAARHAVTATYQAAQDLAFSCLWSGEQLVYLAGIAPPPSSGELRALLQLGGGDQSPAALGAAAEHATGDDSSGWGTDRPLSPRRAALVYTLATQRYVRRMVRRSYRGAPPAVLDDGIVMPSPEDQAASVGLAPAVPILIGVFGVAAIVAGAWAVVEHSHDVTTLEVSHAAIAAEAAIKADIAAKQIAAGQPVTVDLDIQKAAIAEARESTWLPLGVGALAGAAVVAAAWKAWGGSREVREP